MRASDLAGLPIAAGAALRHRRFFHPAGVLANGSIERLAPPTDGLPVESGTVVGRVSKAVGTPGALPDAAGLAWRMPPNPFAATPWDVLLVTAGFGSADAVPNRVLLRAVSTWSAAPYSSLLPLEHAGELWWVRARCSTPIGTTGLSLAAVREAIDGDGVRFDIEQARGRAEFEPLAALTLTDVIPAPEQHDDDVSFDPVRHSAPNVQIWPDWFRSFRAMAYRSSREGRGAE